MGPCDILEPKIMHMQFYVTVSNKEGVAAYSGINSSLWAHNVESTLIQRRDVESTLFNIVCPLGSHSPEYR